MPDTASILNKCTTTVSIKVEINGNDVTDKPGGLISLSVQKGINKIPTANLIFSESYDGCKVKKADSDDFGLGSFIEIKAGYSQDLQTIFKGVIVRQSVQYRTNKPSVFELECKDPVIHMTLLKNKHNHLLSGNDTDGDICKRMLNFYKNLGVHLADGFPLSGFLQPENRVQNEVSDWDFLGLIAEANSYMILVDEGKYNWFKPGEKQDTKNIATMGTNIIEINTDNDARKSDATVKVSYWDPVQQQLVQETATDAQEGKAQGFKLSENISMDGFVPKAAESQANAIENQKKLSSIRGNVKVKGMDIAPGEFLKLEGLGGALDDTHLVSAVTHQVTNASWTTDIQIGLEKTAMSEKIKETPLAKPGLSTPMQGLQIGVVTALENDKQAGHHRVKVRMPQVTRPDQGEDEGFWVRLSTLYAGNNRGFVFRPEIGDEVVLGFLNSDPNNPILLGSLHSNKNPAPYPASDKNPQQGFKSKGEMELIFDDDKKSVEIKTKKGLSVLIDESTGQIVLKDNHQNSITMSSSGMELKSNGTINIKGGNVKIDGTRIDLG